MRRTGDFVRIPVSAGTSNRISKADAVPRQRRFSTERKIIAAFTGAFAVLCIISLVSIHYINTLLHDWDEVSHSHLVLNGIGELQNHLFALPERAHNFATRPDPATFREFQQECAGARDKY